MRKLNPG